MDEFLSEVCSGNSPQLADAAGPYLREESVSFLQTRRPLSIESVLLTQGETGRKKLYLVLANYFDKEEITQVSVGGFKQSIKKIIRIRNCFEQTPCATKAYQRMNRHLEEWRAQRCSGS